MIFLADVPDPTDFPADPPGLRSLDSALRCTICGELFDGPVTLSCGHCFCSCCVRAALQTKQECPTCRSRSNEGHIRPNPVIEEAVLAWKGARGNILELIKEMENVRSGSSNEQTPRRPKRRRDGEITMVEDFEVEYMVGSSSRTTSSKLVLTPKKPRVKPKTKSISSSIPSSDVEESNEDVRMGQGSGSNGIVECPLCGQKVKYLNINAHMDNSCQGYVEDGRSVKKQWAEMFGKQDKDKSRKGKEKEKDSDSVSTDRLPKVSYDTLKDRQLRDMLQEHALLTSGDHATLERRHQHWVMLYNANLDKSVANRKSLPELRREMQQWEQQRSKRKKVQVEDIKAYEKSHQAEFLRLTEAARPNKKHKPDTPNQNVEETLCQGHQESTPP